MFLKRHNWFKIFIEIIYYMYSRQPLISVIIPIYNVEEYLDECVQSIINQTYHNLEIILVDDGSPDRCPLMCDEFAKRDNRIHVIHKVNGGLSSARNAGLDIASGDYISFVDSDDFIDKRMYEILLSGFHDEKIVVTSIIPMKYQDGCISSYLKSWNIKEVRIVEGNDFIYNMITHISCHSACNKLYRLDILKQVRFMEGRNNEDILFMYELGKQIEQNGLKLLELPYKAYYYRMRLESITSTTKVPLQKDIILNLEYMLHNEQNVRIRMELKRQLIANLFAFLDEIVVTPSWSHYYSTFKYKLKSIEWKEITRLYGYKDCLWIWLLCNVPQVRAKIHKITKKYK